MTTARRPAVPPPIRAVRLPVRALATAFAGGLAGLATGAACVVFAPPVGRGAAIAATAKPLAQSSEVGDRSRRATDAVAAVLMPAAEAGVEPGGEAGADAVGLRGTPHSRDGAR